MIISRRKLAGPLSALALTSMGSRWANASSGAPPLGLNTWSLRGLNHDEAIPAILGCMQRAGLRDCQLLFSHAEPTEFDPDFTSMMTAGKTPPTPEQKKEQAQKDDARTAWRLSVPMSYFESIRAQFHSRGMTIRAYSTPLGASAGEIDRAFLMAKTIGATYLNTRLKESLTDVAAAAAERHGISVGIQVVDVAVLAQQLRASSRLTADPDIGDLTKAGIPALDFIREHLDRISSIDLKDAVKGGPSVPFGSGEAHMREVLTVLKRERNGCIPYIDCDYTGTGRSTDEVQRCVTYVRGVLDA